MAAETLIAVVVAAVEFVRAVAVYTERTATAETNGTAGTLLQTRASPSGFHEVEM